MASQYRRRLLMLNTIAKVAQGNPTIITDSSSRRLKRLDIYGQSEQDSTTGAQLLDSSLYRDSATSSGVTYTKQSDGSIKRTGTATNKIGNIWIAGRYFEGKEEPGYSVLFTLQAGTYTVKDCMLFSLSVGYSDTFTIEEPLEISGIRNADLEAGKTYNDVIYPMLNLGNTAKPFEPYTGGKPSPSPDYPQEIISKEVSEIKVTGVNILKLEDIEEATEDGITYSVKDGLIKVKGTAERDANILFHANQNRIALLAGQTYIFNPNPIKGTETLNTYLDFTNLNTLGFSITNNNLNIPKTLNKADADYTFGLAFVCKPGQTVDMEYKPQVLMSNVLLPYEPYKEQTIALPEPITLYGLPIDKSQTPKSDSNVIIDGQEYFSDLIKEKDGVIGVERLYSEQSKQGGWNMAKNTETVEKFFVQYNIFPVVYTVGQYEGLCNICSYSNWSSISKNKWVFCPMGTGMRIAPPSDLYDDMTAEQLNEMLNALEVPVKIIGQLATPTFEPLPDEVQTQYKALKSYYPNTVIQTGCWNEVTYSAKRGG